MLMEIATHLQETGAHVGVGHVPGEQNLWADQLANLDFTGFDMTRRIFPEEWHKDFRVHWDLLRTARRWGWTVRKKERKAVLTSASWGGPIPPSHTGAAPSG